MELEKGVLLEAPVQGWRASTVRSWGSSRADGAPRVWAEGQTQPGKTSGASRGARLVTAQEGATVSVSWPGKGRLLSRGVSESACRWLHTHVQSCDSPA